MVFFYAALKPVRDEGEETEAKIKVNLFITSFTSQCDFHDRQLSRIHTNLERVSFTVRLFDLNQTGAACTRQSLKTKLL